MNLQPYIRASWEIVMECESRSRVSLDEELEAYLVFMVARNFRNRDFPPDVICLAFDRARTNNQGTVWHVVVAEPEPEPEPDAAAAQ